MRGGVSQEGADSSLLENRPPWIEDQDGQSHGGSNEARLGVWRAKAAMAMSQSRWLRPTTRLMSWSRTVMSRLSQKVFCHSANRGVTMPIGPPAITKWL